MGAMSQTPDQETGRTGIAPQPASAHPGAPPPGAAQVPPPAPAPDGPERFPTTVGRDGRLGWSMGLIALIGVPGLAIAAASLGMIIAGLSQRSKNPVARTVGGRAALFGAISLAATLLFFLLVFAILPALENSGAIPPDANAVWALTAAPLGVWVVVAGPLTCIVMGILGLARPVSQEKAARIFADAAR